MKANELRIGGRYTLKLFGTVRPIELLDYCEYSGQKEKPRRIWTVREVETGKCYTVFTARKFLEELPTPEAPLQNLNTALWFAGNRRSDTLVATATDVSTVSAAHETLDTSGQSVQGMPNEQVVEIVVQPNAPDVQGTAAQTPVA